MKIGYCANMNATGPDGTRMEFIEKMAELGFDYIELPLAEMTALSDGDFYSLVRRVKAAGIPCEACNNFFPKTMRLTGPGVDEAAIASYVEKALGRAALLGVEHVVFGSGPAKSVPDGFPSEEGYRQVAPVAEKNGITIVIEPLRRAECNLINTFAEGCALAEAVDHQRVKVLVDYYHLCQEAEPVENILKNGRRYLRHVHFARNEGRSFPQTAFEDDYKPFMDALKVVGYDRRVSLEAYTPDFDREAPTALGFLRVQLK